mmetsp:Transcript_42974/g.84451  ORF Transcript_42974/g.84451 Transcript_42974/m.84451 type:complete len:218 (-) Transcript_42974:611-1264(-)
MTEKTRFYLCVIFLLAVNHEDPFTTAVKALTCRLSIVTIFASVASNVPSDPSSFFLLIICTAPITLPWWFLTGTHMMLRVRKPVPSSTAALKRASWYASWRVTIAPLATHAPTTPVVAAIRISRCRPVATCVHSSPFWSSSIHSAHRSARTSLWPSSIRDVKMVVSSRAFFSRSVRSVSINNKQLMPRRQPHTTPTQPPVEVQMRDLRSASWAWDRP